MGPGALETALALYHAPSLAAATRLRPLPGDVFEVIRIAAGDAEATATAVERSGSSDAVVREASQLYLEHVLFDPDADHYRVLGVPADAGAERMREHRRWLLKWLHPDRADDWDAVYAARVQQAWQHLRDPERRARYDQALAEADDWTGSPVGPALRPVWTARELQAGEGAPSRTGRAAWLLALAVPVLAGAVAWMAWPVMVPSPPAQPVPVPTLGPEAAGVAYVLERVPVPDAPDAPDAGEPVAREPGPPAAPPAAGAAMPPAAPAPPTARPEQGSPSMVTTGLASVEPVQQPEPPAPPPAPARERIDTAAIESTMNAFRTAYERGDIEALMEVFTHDARNRRGGRDAIRRDYLELFRSSRQRRLQWHSLQWQAGPDRAVGEGGFVAGITPRRGATNTVRGRLRVEIVQRGNQVGILELWHEDQAP